MGSEQFLSQPRSGYTNLKWEENKVVSSMVNVCRPTFNSFIPHCPFKKMQVFTTRETDRVKINQLWVNKDKITGIWIGIFWLTCWPSTKWDIEPYVGSLPILSKSLFRGRQPEVQQPYAAVHPSLWYNPGSGSQGITLGGCDFLFLISSNKPK